MGILRLCSDYAWGYTDGSTGVVYRNPYHELSVEWLQYDRGYDDGLKRFKDITLAMAF